MNYKTRFPLRKYSLILMSPYVSMESCILLGIEDSDNEAVLKTLLDLRGLSSVLEEDLDLPLALERLV